MTTNNDKKFNDAYIKLSRELNEVNKYQMKCILSWIITRKEPENVNR